jgi:ribose 5-phosphate isomerase B
MKICIGSDHRGFALKNKLIEALNKNYDITDLGTYSDESTDYPKYGFLVGEAVANKKYDYGIVICGSGIGISIACNKVKGVRCAKVENAEEAYYTRNDNDSNVVAFSEKLDFDEALRIVEKFLETPFSNLERHQKRIDMITKYENGEYHDR